MSDTDTDHLRRIAGGIDAYEFYVWTVLYFRCDGCDASLDCPITEQDTEAPEGPWMRRSAHQAHSLGWYVPPLSPDGSLTVFALCPRCTQTRGLTIPNATGNV